ncbi:MAG: hypothetical protein K9J30_10560 [Bacteroidales bacterium]|nr:hypothetical protein [Bacteroidales bacterium]
MKPLKYICLLILPALVVGCENSYQQEPNDPNTAEKVVVDRFSESAGTLHIRDSSNNLPDPGEAIDFDVPRFLAKGLGPNGEYVQYYDFDVQPLTTAPVYVFFREGEESPVDGQLNILDVIPGEEGYTDFWSMKKVMVPEDYVPNSISSYDEILESGYEILATTKVINCPVVPDGSTADLRYRASESDALHRGWYKRKLVYYFTFEEKEITVSLPEAGEPLMPISGIFVTFNINPDQEDGGPASGFVQEPGTSQTHNVLETIPEDEDYSPLWSVNVYDNQDFENVNDWESASNATLLASGVMLVNCPVVKVE